MRLQQDFSSLVGMAVIVVAVGCSSGDPAPPGAGGAGGTGPGASSQITSSSSASSGGASSSGGGGSMEMPNFTLSIVPIAVEIPYGGETPVALRVRRLDGFDAPIDVVVNNPPDGLSALALTIPGDASEGVLVVGASGALRVGSQFDLALVGISGNMLRFAAVSATVIDGN